jgi:predicted nucleic acid-binding protein
MDDPRKTLIAIDSNVFDVKDLNHSKILERFDDLISSGMVRLLVTDSVWREISDPNTPPTIVSRYKRHYLSLPYKKTLESERKRGLARAILMGAGPKYRHSQDAQIISEAFESGAGYLITEDKRIASKDLELRVLYPNLEIRSLAELLRIYNEYESGLRA